MEPRFKKQNGIVAILDALGAATYTDEEVEQFLKSREIALNSMVPKIADVGHRIDAKQLEFFTFNDTILIFLKTGETPPSLEEIFAFVGILRTFLVKSLENHIPFRGTWAIGTFYADSPSNTVMGQAITDAAAWYDKADWIGIHATPRTSLIVQRWMEKSSNPRKHLMPGYQIPLKGGAFVNAKAVNWPKIFLMPNATPCKSGQKPREKLLELLSAHPVPIGTEGKYANAVKFFDFAIKQIEGPEKTNSQKTRTQSSPTRHT